MILVQLMLSRDLKFAMLVTIVNVQLSVGCKPQQLQPGASSQCQGRPFYGGEWRMLKFQGGRKKLLEILCNVMQRTVGHDQSL